MAYPMFHWYVAELVISLESAVQLRTDVQCKLENRHFNREETFATVYERRGSRGTPLPASLRKVLGAGLGRELLKSSLYVRSKNRLKKSSFVKFKTLWLLSIKETCLGKRLRQVTQDIVHDDVAMDYYGKRLATASSDNAIKIIGVSNSRSQHHATLTGHQGPVWQVAWAHPKFGSILASCSYDGKVVIWKEGNQNESIQAHVFDDHKASVNCISWAPHELGLRLACGSADGNISVFTARSDGGWDKSQIEHAHPVGVTSVTWAPSTAIGALVGPGLLNPVQKLASGGCDNTVKVWKFDNGTWRMDCFRALIMHTDWVRDVSWAPNLGLPKSMIASASEDGKVIIWTALKEGDQWDGKILKDFGSPVWRVSWSLTGNTLAVADGKNNITVWKEAVDGEWLQVTTVES
ncbi:UNVERIFIED_CONTAM: protein transport protein SEC13A [Sesamum angustifolium]|uniref:Protein transport protein SEC13A n=1 Tax=Sesamum angustifolium TaxID=2727405 RepID=A0AAW2RK46_9LAMI